MLLKRSSGANSVLVAFVVAPIAIASGLVAGERAAPAASRAGLHSGAPQGRALVPWKAGAGTRFTLPSLAKRFTPGNGVEITFLSSNTFIVTDPITLRATVRGGGPNTPVFWSVFGQGAASGVGGFPTNQARAIDSAGISTFTFTPSGSGNLVNDRHQRWTRGSRSPNTAIGFEVSARAVVGGIQYFSSLSQTSLGPLSQNEKDRLRQEYYDYNIAIPGPEEVVSSLGPGFNAGNYSGQLSVDLVGHYNTVLQNYRGRQVFITVTYGGQTYENVAATIPSNAPVLISSGYRNPQRNRAEGSHYPENRHTRGAALDLVPVSVQARVQIPGGPVIRYPLPLHETLYPALRDAASAAGAAICERDNCPCECGNTTIICPPAPGMGENHVHVQW